VELSENERPTVSLNKTVPQRASHADREAVAEILHNALADGQLIMPELEDRLHTLYRCVTQDELLPLTADLSRQPPFARPHRPDLRPPVVNLPRTGQSDGRVWAVFSSVVRKGDWSAPGHLEVGALAGTVKLDLREADFEHPHLTITAYTFWGGIEIVVPDDVEVVVDGNGIMGAFENRAGLPARHYDGGGAQSAAATTRATVRVTGFAVMAGVQIRRATKKERRKAGQHK
jgi:hypothetical protein